ncbi:MAG: nucleotidyltransferase family protein [Dehalococcoidia bacterium]
MRRVGIIPAAGYATRLQPLPCSKEVYPVRGRPVMDYLVERMRAAGCAELRVVTRPEKADVIEHATELGATVMLDRPPTLTRSFLRGLGGLDADDIALLGFPDSIWQPEDGFTRLVAAVEDGQELVLGLFQTSDPERSDVVTFLPSGQVTDIQIKPAVPSSNWIWGCAAARVRALRGLEEADEPSAAIKARCADGGVHGICLGSLIDVGTPASLRLAQHDNVLVE